MRFFKTGLSSNKVFFQSGNSLWNFSEILENQHVFVSDELIENKQKVKNVSNVQSGKH